MTIRLRIKKFQFNKFYGQFKNNTLYVYISSDAPFCRETDCYPNKSENFRQRTVAVFQNLLANGLWIIIVAAVTFVAAFLKKVW